MSRASDYAAQMAIATTERTRGEGLRARPEPFIVEAPGANGLVVRIAFVSVREDGGAHLVGDVLPPALPRFLSWIEETFR